MVAYLTSIEVRRRWRSLALIALLVAVVVGTVLASVAGARRSRTAFDRYLAVVNPPHAMAFGDPEVLDRLGDAPGVEAALSIELAAIFPAAETEDFFPMAVSLDGRVPYEYLRYPVVEGRLADPAAPLEVTLGERTAARLGAGVGDEIPMLSLSGEAALDAEESGDFEPDGPELRLDVVGIVREAGDIASRESDLALTFLTPAFRERYDTDQIGTIGEGSFVVLADGGDTAQLAESFGGEDLELDSSFSSDVARRQANPTMRSIATGLLVLALVAGVAGTAAIAHALGRMHQSGAEDDAVLAALGVERRGRWARQLLPASGAVAVGTVLGLVLAVLASPRFPIGLARRAEPDLGLDLDGGVLVVGGTVALAVGLGLTAWLAAAATRGATRSRPTRPVSRAARRAADSGAPSSLVTGLSLASGTPGAPARAAMTGTALGVLGVVAALVFSASLDHLAATPRLYGWGWDANIAGADLSHVPDGAVDERALLDDPDLAAVADVSFQVAIHLDGIPDSGIVAHDVKGHVRPVIVEGDEPRGPDEVALGVDSLERIGKEVGDAVDVGIGGQVRTMRVAGIVTLPVSQDGGSSTIGAFMRAEGAEALAFDCDEQSSCYQNVAVVAAPGVDVEVLRDRYTDPDADIAVDLPMPPGEIERLQAVEQLPRYLAVFLAILAGVSVTYVAAMTVRRRRGDLAVLRVLGMTATGVRSVVTYQVLALTLAGAVIGAALGVAVGRQIWRLIASDVSVPFAPRTPVAVIVLVPLATVALTQAAASLSRRSAGRIKPAIALRTE
ncbi:MAG: FtsX-like permease family protein [Acidimicrobiales bacterium]